MMLQQQRNDDQRRREEEQERKRARREEKRDKQWTDALTLLAGVFANNNGVPAQNVLGNITNKRSALLSKSKRKRGLGRSSGVHTRSSLDLTSDVSSDSDDSS